MVTIDSRRVAIFADFFRRTAGVQPFDFCHVAGPATYPPSGGSNLVNYLFFNAGHQFGFWNLEGDRYAGPMVAAVDGHALKGSDYVSYCLTRLWKRDPGAFAPAAIPKTDWNAVFTGDDGRNPLPLWDEHADIIARYAKWFADRAVTPEEIVRRANNEARSLECFLAEAGQAPGYVEDPLRKKLFLLAIMLENRPERFLVVTDPESYDPIIDYHLQRSALRTGLVRVEDEALRDLLVARRLISADREKLVRQTTFDAVRELVRQSGKSVAAIDFFFFMNRRRCPEMTEPDCAQCAVQPICARATDLFQPVFRTTAY